MCGTELPALAFSSPNMFAVQMTWLQQIGKTALVGLCPSMTLKSNLVKRTACLWSFWLWLGYFNSLVTLSSFSIMRGRTYMWWHLLHNTKYSAITSKTAPGVQAIVYRWQQTHIHVLYGTALQVIHGSPPLPTASCFCRYLTADLENICSSDKSLNEQRAVQSFNPLYALNSRAYTKISG